MNVIMEVELDGRKVSDPSQVKRGIAEFFREHFKRTTHFRPNISNLVQKVLTRRESEKLEEPFSREEVLAAVKGCDGNKAPGAGWLES